MYLCYIDESGTPDIPGNTTHYVLAGLSVPIWHWKGCDKDIQTIKKNYGLGDAEIHTAWMLRKYRLQTKVPSFATLPYPQRRSEVASLRLGEIYRLQRSKNTKNYKRTKKNYKKTDAYIHLTYQERRKVIYAIAECVKSWGFARLFAECVDKIHFDPLRAPQSVDEQSFEQVVSRFEQYLQVAKTSDHNQNYGLLIHDNNPTVSRKLTRKMRAYLKQGTDWTSVKHIIETPLFVDSHLTSMVQVADLCSYSLRRYLENGEEDLFGLIFDRADRRHEVVVGVRHFTKKPCPCQICTTHG
jgi:hypothetical protein